MLLATVPSSSSYILNSYGFSGGANNGGSATYKVSGSAGTAGGVLGSSTYKLPAGIKASTTAPTPGAPTFTNPANNYDRLKLVLNASSFPSDTKYLVAISTDGFTTTQYIQTDNTIGASLSVSNYQTYAAWGGASGVTIVGLTSGTTYSVKVAALQGNGTGSDFGPTATAATVAPSVTFDITTSLTSTPPFTTTFSSLTPGSVINGSTTIIAAITTNALNGGGLYIQSQFGGLKSTLASYTLTSATADLTAAGKGYGARVSAVSQSSGGPVIAASPYNGSGNNVGNLGTALQPLASFSAPITNGNITTTLTAKTDISVPSANDYSDTITMSLSLLF